MLSGGWLFVFSIGYLAVLFAIAWVGDKRGLTRSGRERPLVYALALCVYCTSWTFYGAVGTAVNGGLAYVPIYLGPILVFLFATGLLRRIIIITRRYSITSIADFIASRFGKARSLAVLVTVIAVVGTVPYIALQLKAVSMSYALVAIPDDTPFFPMLDTAFYTAVILAIFAVLFGTRQLDASEHRQGMMLAVAFESLVKLAAFTAVGLYAVNHVFTGPVDLFEKIVTQPELRGKFLPGNLPDGFLAQTVLAMIAIFCLPRQFQVAAVEASGPRELQRARWLFPLYLMVFTLFVIPIAAAGMLNLPAGVAPDNYVLALPAAGNNKALTLFTFIGGFSAATAMVIVASVALSTMISNEIVLPYLLRTEETPRNAHRDFSRLLPIARTASIFMVLFAAWVFHHVVDEGAALASIGLLSFAMAAQLGPAVVLGIYWRRASRRGAMAGLLVGFIVWLDMLMLPAISSMPSSLAVLLGMTDMDSITAGVSVSLFLNTASLVIVSLLDQPTLEERLQAAAFTGRNIAVSQPGASRKLDITIGELETLAGRFLGEYNARRAMSEYLDKSHLAYESDLQAARHIAQFTERLIAGAVGSASARMVMTSVLSQGGTSIGDVMRMLDETSEAIRFNRNLLEATLDNITQGVSVVDADLRLVGWNSRYEELLDYPEGFLYIGRPVAELIRFNAERGLIDSGMTEEHVRKRLDYMQAGSSYRFEREREDGQVLEIRGSPLPSGGFVTTYSDVSEYKKIERALRESEENVRFYTDNAPAMLVYIDRDYRYRFANKAYCDYLGMSRDAMMGQRMEDCVPPRDWQARQGYVRDALAGKRQDVEFPLQLADGSEQYVLARYIPHRDDAGIVHGVYVIFQDISSRRHAELELQEAKALLETRVEERTRELTHVVDELQNAKSAADQANQTKTRFLAAASHDLLQPMNAASLFTSVLVQKAEEKDEELAALAQRVADSLAAAEDILGALLDISKLDRDAMQPEISVFSVDDFLKTLERQFAALADERGLQLDVHSCAGHVRSDRQLLRRILQNFLTNALRYTPRGGHILLSARRRGEQVEFGVWDNGAGIAPEHQQVIFEEFRRLETSGVQRERGLGLGLAIADRIARMLTHPLDLKSRPGRGSCFSIRVPAAQPGEQRATVPTPGVGEVAGLDIWCLDNEDSILAGMQEVLQRWQCKVRVFHRAEDMQAAVYDGEQPDVVLADYHLDGDVTGLDALLACRGMIPDLRAIVISADRSEEVLGAVRDAGFSILQKPLKPASLRAAIGSLKPQRRNGDAG